MKFHVLALVAVAAFPNALAAREWTDLSGNYHREAEFLFARDGHVWLQDAGGTTYRIALAKLSVSDRDLVATLEQPNRTPAKKLVARTLGYRKSANRPLAPAAAPSASQATAGESVFRLTGWHCHSGCCPIVIDCCPSPCPVHPCPPPPDKGKRIIKGWHSTFHLVTRVKDEIGGTGSYKFVERDGCCHHYLELLKFAMHTTNNDLVYNVVGSAPILNLTQWMFTPVPNSHEWYWVYYKSTASTAWVYYDIACGKIVE